jgi:hypothetical protein
LHGTNTLLFTPYRQAEEAEARAASAKGSAAAAVRGARQAGARLRGKDSEVALADLHAVAEARLAGWAAWVTSRNSMDESFQDGAEAKVGSEHLLGSCSAQRNPC